MSEEERDTLWNEVAEAHPLLQDFLRESPTCIVAGSWDLVSFSFQRGFDAMWDLAKADHTGLLHLPLLVLWRHSVELALKTAILETAGRIEGKPSHKLDVLFEQLLRVRANEGCCDDDDLTSNVHAMIRFVQSFDPFAERFRYPFGKKGSYDGVSVDLDELFKAHLIVVTWCEGGVYELKGDR